MKYKYEVYKRGLNFENDKRVRIYNTYYEAKRYIDSLMLPTNISDKYKNYYIKEIEG